MEVRRLTPVVLSLGLIEEEDRTDIGVFLGTQLAMLSRALAVVGESVRKAYLAMDSVFLGKAERQKIRLRFAGLQIEVPPDNEPFTFPEDTPSLTIAELLGWVELFASEEGLRLVHEGGKEGVISWRAVIDTLRRLVRGAWKISETQSGNPVKGFHTPRVQRSLQELATHLDETFMLYDQITREAVALHSILITGVTFAPTETVVGSILSVSITVRNNSTETLETQGPDPGFIYSEGDTFDDSGYAGKAGMYRVGVDFQEREHDGIAVDHPYRWGLSAPLAPGEERTIQGGIRLASERTQDYWAGLVQEGVAWLHDGQGRQAITVTDPRIPIAKVRRGG